MAHVAELRRRFVDALALAGGMGFGGAVFDELVARYGEVHRHYHTLDHVEACLAWLDVHAGLADRPAEVALALWFHDAIYDPRAQDNERRSAELARERLRALGVHPDATERIGAQIIGTQDHDVDHGDCRLVVDIDLTILGTSPVVFDDFEQRIRREYAHVPDAVFQRGRRHVLERFLERPTIYRVPELREQLEAATRANLRRRVAELSGHPS